MNDLLKLLSDGEKRVFSNKKYPEHSGVSNRTCIGDMRLLKKLGFAGVAGNGKSIFYRATESSVDKMREETQ